jgi:precorrin-3B C17-methyltransferase
VGIVSRANRPGQQVSITTLAQLPKAEVDMQTTVFIGNSTTSRYLDFLITPRGYSAKYRIEDHRPAGIRPGSKAKAGGRKGPS